MPFAFATGGGETGAAASFKNPIFLRKPFDFESVKKVLGELLNQRAA